jgi:hypothetical protein
MSRWSGWGRGGRRRAPGYAAVLATLLLAGCGGGDDATGPGPSGLDVAEVAGTVDLGAPGAPVDVAGLQVLTAAGRSAVGADGSVVTRIFEAGPQYAEALDGGGRPVLLAFVSEAAPGFSARSTATVLAYLALGGPWMREAGRLEVLDEVHTVAGFDALAAAVQGQVSTAGHLDLEAPAILEAVATMVEAAYGAAAPAASRARSVLTEPTMASGLALDNTVDGKLTVQNTYLRRVALMYRRVSHVNAAGQEVDESNAFTRVDLPLVARYGGITGTLDGFFKGEIPYSPESTEPPLDVPLFPGDARSTTYQVLALGPGFDSDPNLNVPADVIAAQEYLELQSLFLDAFLVLVANVALPLAGDQVDAYLEFAAANAVITDIIGNLRSTVPQVWDALAAGAYYDAVTTLATSAYTSNTILPAVSQLTLDFLWANTGIDADDYERLFGGMKGVLDKMGKIDVGFTLADNFILFRDVAKSRKIEQFLVTTRRGRVTLVPANATIRPDQTTTIDAVIQNRDTAGVYEYRWSVSPAASYWVEDRTLNGSDDAPDGVLVTGESRVNIRSLVTTDGTATVLCRVFRLDGGRRDAGEGEVTITFRSGLQPFEVPSTVVIQATNALPTLDGAGQLRSEYAFVHTMVVFDVRQGLTYRLFHGDFPHGPVLTAADIARGAPVFDLSANYGIGTTWPAPYWSNWYNLGGGRAGFSYGARAVTANAGQYRRPGDPTLAEAIARVTAQQQGVIARNNPRIFRDP